MKVCSKCGAINSDGKFFCVDCGEKLDDSLSENEQKRVEQKIDSNLENLYNENDPFRVTLFDKISGIISIVGLILCFAVLFANTFIKADIKFLWVSILLLILSTVETLCPKFLWCIEKFRLSFTISNSDDAEPSVFYRFCRVLAIFIEQIFALILIVEAFFIILK